MHLAKSEVPQVAPAGVLQQRAWEPGGKGAGSGRVLHSTVTELALHLRCTVGKEETTTHSLHTGALCKAAAASAAGNTERPACPYPPLRREHPRGGQHQQHVLHRFRHALLHRLMPHHHAVLQCSARSENRHGCRSTASRAVRPAGKRRCSAPPPRAAATLRLHGDMPAARPQQQRPQQAERARLPAGLAAPPPRGRKSPCRPG